MKIRDNLEISIIKLKRVFLPKYINSNTFTLKLSLNILMKFFLKNLIIEKFSGLFKLHI